MKNLSLQLPKFTRAREMKGTLLPILAFTFALLFGGVMLLLVGVSPFRAYQIIVVKASNDFGAVLGRATPLMLTALAVIIPQKSGVFNMGGEGQIFIGALAAGVAGAYIQGLPWALHLPISIMAGALGGFLWGLMAGFFKYRYGANEVVITIMLNYVALYLTDYLVAYPFAARADAPRTPVIADSAILPKVVPRTQWSSALFLAIILCFAVKWFFDNTTWGLEMKCAGLSPGTARYKGIKIGTLTLISLALGGALAGIGGAGEVLGSQYHYLQGYVSSFGYDGIAVACMASYHPLGVILTSIVIASLRVGGIALSRELGVSTDFVVALQGVVIMFLVTPLIAETFLKKGMSSRLKRRSDKLNA